ncbi:hypothetical protein A2715_05430 [Candidatus Woesebacteria bacterium RIFCSPHIGHO2_01_FULL_39_32]|uniref:Uncharacterized protein n=1 Tax=Candidatus Woesebacteria bacterium RIFCSPLOWO2_01_FULL_39_25 TaxID=1802521 RepID=A0A1F8BLT8_9BACT|nr:MAG: hypothetical protein A2124_03870 [Candidatus Woesebacteria bacterium GWB1_37_5]OGM25461.1 MAG: hypothetical protein A2715_05430 [Candidatus Woesebacteria bacterium RIFCSPHIGHO2_01_FULL_39_32]OGM38564.1 MAG: hypothetical protein A3F01_04385 [Candidatus Woesebacteria bacterium RIFCSPHIGHO2_12_FULL_38_11]OGM64992.1 MAG: hypothetical protein A2893_05040 [Candidatus Woesebacteria bacterium RIFCSPLOWO2_01_FULL_39_25]
MKFKIVGFLHIFALLILILIYSQLIIPTTIYYFRNFNKIQLNTYQIFWEIFINFLFLSLAFLHFNTGKEVLRNKRLSYLSTLLLVITYMPLLGIFYTFISVIRNSYILE